MDNSDQSASCIIEGITSDGRLFLVNCPADQIEATRKLLANIHSIRSPISGRVKALPGVEGQYTRYDIEQLGCQGRDWWYTVEVLSIKNPPDNRCGFVIHDRREADKVVFTEWDTAEAACAAFKLIWGSGFGSKDEIAKVSGFRRLVPCGMLTPWFYAIGEERLIGDYAFPAGFQDDPVYRFGRQFVVYDQAESPVIKTCMGSRLLRYSEYGFFNKERYARLVYWHDGSIWDENNGRGCLPPRPVEEGETWAYEAAKQFQRLLAGNITKFSINFTDGNRFDGKLVQPNRRVPCAAGTYNLTIQTKGRSKSFEYTVNFSPTIDDPDVVQYVTRLCFERGIDVEHVIINQSWVESGGKKWAGSFFAPPKK